MYLKHFGLTAFPFDKEIPADELFVSAAMSELAVRLAHLTEM
jgi:general secretion pathway protein A